MGYFLEATSMGQPLDAIPLPSEGRLTIGRHPNCTVVIDDPHLSRQQLELRVVAAGRVVVKDLGTKNPVYLNQQVIKEATVTHGDRIEVGATVLVLREGERPTPAEITHTVLFVPDTDASGTKTFSVPTDSVKAILPDSVVTGPNDQKLEGFYHLAEEVAQAEDPDRFFGEVLEVLFTVLPAHRGFIALGDPQHGELTPVRTKLRGEQGEASFEMSQTIINEIQRGRQGMLVVNVKDEFPRGGLNSIMNIGIRSFMCSPMFIGDDMLGVLYLDQLDEVRIFNEEDLHFLQGIARLCSVAIDSLQFRERLRRENAQLRDILDRRGQFIAKSPGMVKILQNIHKMARLERDTPILITGETGTGKELIARMIHDHSPRREGPFIAFNCALSNSSLIESALFGHVKGAFTDASRDHKGKFQLADGGTIFLDEIGDMPKETQVKLLRVLQDKVIEPVGSEKPISVDFRMISATHRDLTAMREREEFRDDLFWRLQGLPVELPPLRERGDDVLEIARSMLPEGMTIDPPAEKALRAYPWPGNIRELSNVIEQATFNTEGTKIRLRDLPANVASEGRKGRVEIPLARLADVEAKHILKVLRACDGNKKRSAEILGISRETLYQKLRLYRLNP